MSYRSQGMTKTDLAAHLLQSACALRARDELLQEAIARVRAANTVTVADWQALALAQEAALRVPSSVLILLATYIQPETEPPPQEPGSSSKAKRALRKVARAVLDITE